MCVSYDTNTNEFLSTPSARRATSRVATDYIEESDFYPRPPRGGRPSFFETVHNYIDISIHALREEGDRYKPMQYLPLHYFYPRPPRGGRPSNKIIWCPFDKISIHALREEGDDERGCKEWEKKEFLSTPSARRATGTRSGCGSSHTHFYPRPPRGGRRQFIHRMNVFQQFLSTPSARRATNASGREAESNTISIHALREEGDVHPLYIYYYT